ncbi:hypothetical protein [Flaviaesturariibacter flavus]|uniref:hypothetical protein n=1 Tax=Flaviaesturariibacter flavus TaxID=2502780 RepID=UPI001404E705|nr:hypothetical protein [Flaviaesturariibacter flavus]
MLKLLSGLCLGKHNNVSDRNFFVSPMMLFQAQVIIAVFIVEEFEEHEIRPLYLLLTT